MFDIIVVTYNSGEKLKTTLDSIYAQDFWDYRVVIKDGASTDGSLSNLCDSGYFDEFRSARTTIIVAPRHWNLLRSQAADSLHTAPCSDLFR